MGVKTIQLTEAKGKLAGARVVRDGYQVMLISTGGTVIRMPVEDVKRLGRSTQGVIVMRLRGDETGLCARAGRRLRGRGGRGARGERRPPATSAGDATLRRSLIRASALTQRGRFRQPSLPKCNFMGL